MIAIHVTKQHIQSGIRGNPRRCVIALAASEALDHPVEVGAHFIHALDTILRWELPIAIVEYIEAFDRGDAVRPITFTVGDPE